MEISIKNNREIEELADEIISLEEITTNTTEVKTKIINLITDKLYHSIKNVSLSTIIKDQLETPQVTKKNGQTAVTKPVHVETADQPTEPEPTEPTKPDMTKVTPEEIFGKKPAAAPSEPATKPASAEPQPAAPKEEPVASAEPEMVDTTIKDDAMPFSTPDPLTQYQQNNKAQSGNLTYNGTNYNYSIKKIKRGSLAGQDAIVVEYHVPASINDQIINNPAIKDEIETAVKQLNAKYEGQTPTFYNAAHSLAFVIATESTLNDYVNDLDTIMHLIQNKTNAFSEIGE